MKDSIEWPNQKWENQWKNGITAIETWFWF